MSLSLPSYFLLSSNFHHLTLPWGSGFKINHFVGPYSKFIKGKKYDWLGKFWIANNLLGIFFSPWIDWNLCPCQMIKLGFEFKERYLKVKKSVLVNTDIFSPILILMLNICFLFLWSVMSFLKVKKKKRKWYFFYQSLYSCSAWFLKKNQEQGQWFFNSIFIDETSWMYKSFNL